MDFTQLMQYGLAGMMVALYAFKIAPAQLTAFRAEMAAERASCAANLDRVVSSVDKLASKIDTLIDREKRNAP